MDDPAKRLENYREMFLNGKLSEEEFQILKNAITSESGSDTNEMEEFKMVEFKMEE